MDFHLESPMAIHESKQNPTVDKLDMQLIRRLMRNGRASWTELALDFGLTAPAVAQRVRRLELRGVIRQFTAWVAPEAVAPVCAFVAVGLDFPGHREAFRREVAKLECIQECHHLGGETPYLLKVRCGSMAELEELASRTLPELPGVSHLRTSVVLSTVKESPVLPVFNLTSG